MVSFKSLAAALALTSAAVAVPAALPAPADALAPIETGDAPPTIYRSKEDALEQADAFRANSTERRDLADLDERQIPSFGRYCDNWDYQGACVYHRFEIDNAGHYIGDAWNDRISSVEGFDYDKKCIYWTEYEWNGNYCWGDGIIVQGRVSYPRLGSPYNERLSCRECSWN